MNLQLYCMQVYVEQTANTVYAEHRDKQHIDCVHLVVFANKSFVFGEREQDNICLNKLHSFGEITANNVEMMEYLQLEEKT